MENTNNLLALRLLRIFCPAHLEEEIEGDLLQKYERDLKKFNVQKSKRRLLWNTLRFFRPGILLRNKPSTPLNSIDMLSNYFKVALRFMFRNKTYSAINIFGLAFGMTGAILLFLWIGHDFSYDNFHADRDRIYKAFNRSNNNGQLTVWDATPRILAPTLQTEYTSVEEAVSFATFADSYVFKAGETKLMKNQAIFADPAFLKIFSFPLVKGATKDALANPNSIVLTESFAKQLFGDKDAFGETIIINAYSTDFPFTVTGIAKDIPGNTDIRFEYLIPFSFLESLGEKNDNWDNNSVYTYVKLKPGADLATLQTDIKKIRERHTQDKEAAEIFLYPFTQMHLYSRFENGVPSGGRIEIVRMLGILGVCLVVIACINFINLSTARAQRRSKEVAVRKVTGALRRAIIIQFLCESLLIAFTAGVISLLAAYVTLPLFNGLIRQQLTLDFSNVMFWGTAFGLIVLIGILAGSYPAIYLSSFKPVKILKGASVTASGRNWLRSTLVVIQFGFATTLIISTVVIYQQIKFVQDRDSGYAKENLVYHYITGDIGKNFTAYKNEILQTGAAVSVSKTSSPVTDRLSNTSDIQWNGKDPQDKTVFERFYIDEKIAATAGFTLVEGRDLDLEKFPSDSSAMLLNETAVKVMGLKNPVGELIRDGRLECRVVGVVKDFILTSPYRKVEPMVLMPGNQWFFNVIHIRLNPAKTTRENLELLTAAYAKYNPEHPFEYHFADVEYARKFADIKTTLTITTVFTSIAIFIACLGLLGLSTYMIETRVKEIGIRKVMGGSAVSITKLLSYSSLKPILIAIVLFTPQAWFAMNWYLSSFAYRISLSGWIFLASALVMITIALLTIGLQTMRAASANPVESLRNE